MRSWLYLHPTWAWVISVIGVIACSSLSFYCFFEMDGWWRLLGLGWGVWAWRCMDATERFWRLS